MPYTSWYQKYEEFFMQIRQDTLNQWLNTQLTNKPFTLTPLTSDASFRRYFRLSTDTGTLVVMDAPPDKETMAPFIHVSNLLKTTNILTPAIHAADTNQGFALLDDLGDTLFLKALTSCNQDYLYSMAINTLLEMQKCSTIALPAFNTQHMLNEMMLFPEWFLTAYLGLTLSASEHQLLSTTFNYLSNRLNKQPQVFIHRDYHSRNLMLMLNETTPNLSVIDFQDAMLGPITYDLVSLLKDCYIKLPESAYCDFASLYYQHQPLVQTWSFQEFLNEVDFCGLQRHLKVLGIFCRLHLRDNKSNYLQDLPLTLDYTLSCLRKHTEFEPLLDFMEKRALPRFKELCLA